MEERSLHLLDYVAVVKRRIYWLVVPIVIGLLAGAVMVMVLPRQYQASTTLAVTSPSLSGDLVKSGTTDLTERVRGLEAGRVAADR